MGGRGLVFVVAGFFVGHVSPSLKSHVSSIISIKDYSISRWMDRKLEAPSSIQGKVSQSKASNTVERISKIGIK